MTTKDNCSGTCPGCFLPVIGLGKADDAGVAWHLSCAEREEKSVPKPDAESRELALA